MRDYIMYILIVCLNFFYISKDDDQCAKDHGDRHLHKMIVEHAQILSYVWHNLHPDCEEITTRIYKPSKGHVKHPIVLWAQSSIAHYRKIVSVTESLVKERKRRGFEKVHETEKVLLFLKEHEPEISNTSWRDPPKCMPIEYHVDKDGNEFSVIQSYRLLYAGDKVQIAQLRWKPRTDEPQWLNECKKYIESRDDIKKGILERKKKSDQVKKRKRERNQKKRNGTKTLEKEMLNAKNLKRHKHEEDTEKQAQAIIANILQAKNL